MMVGLTTFEAPLLRLILCAGDGLAPAYGPLFGPRIGDMEQARFIWDGEGIALLDGDDESVYGLLDAGRDLDGWLMPLDASPWPARLALVAALLASAWMPSGVSAEVAICERWLHLYTYSGGASDVRSWACNDGGNIEPGAVRLDLPTLPTHLADHPPVVALPSALFDVPEIRARVEAL